MLRRARKLYLRLGGDPADDEYPDEPRRMRWTTHNLLMDKLVAAGVVAGERLAQLAAWLEKCEAAGFPFQINSHVLRHSRGYRLTNDGRDTRSIQHYLGHRSIASTVRYMALAPDRFKDFWKD